MKSLNMALATLLLFTTTGMAQTRTRRTPTRRTTSPPATSQLESTRNNAARIQLAGLNKDMTRFLYVYGRLSKDLELTISDPQSADAANQTRTGLINSLHVMSGRLDQIERQFRFTAGLDRHYRTLQGVSSKGAQAESAASAGRFDQAGRILIEVAAQLTDVLIEM